jgi:hypothetical protein
MNTEPRSLVTYRGGAAQAWQRLSGNGGSVADPVRAGRTG